MTTPTAIETPSPLDRHFADLRITVQTYAHAPVFTVAEGAGFKHQMPGGHTKNLFLKNKKDQLWLVTALHDTVIDLKWLAKRLSTGGLSFGKAELLQEVLGVPAGSVTPLALVNDTKAQMTFVLDAKILTHDLVNCHPLRNDMTTALKPQDLIRFVEELGYKPVIVDF